MGVTPILCQRCVLMRCLNVITGAFLLWAFGSSCAASGAGLGLTHAANEQSQNTIIDLEVNQVPLVEVLYELAHAANVNLVIDQNIDRKVSLVFQHIEAIEALGMVCRGFNLSCKHEEQGFLVSQSVAENAAEVLPLQRIKLNYIEAEQVLVALKDVSALLSPQGQLLADNRSQQVLIYDHVPKANNLGRIIKQLDQPLNQLLIESRIVIARTDLGHTSGLDFVGVLGQHNNPAQGAQLAAAFGQAGGGLQLGLVGAHVMLQLELAALEASGEVLTLAQPHILVQEGYAGSIETGQEVPYVINTEGRQQQQWKQAVLGLVVTPRILPNEQVQLDLLVTQDSVGDLLPNGQLALNTHRLKTRAVVGLGQTLVLGGALYEQQLERIITSPALSGLPWIGQWFERSKRGSERFELLVFVTPRIVNP